MMQCGTNYRHLEDIKCHCCWVNMGDLSTQATEEATLIMAKQFVAEAEAAVA